MSLPDLNRQIELFGLHLQRDKLFTAEDRYRLFAEKVYPILLRSRERLEACYCSDNGRPAKEPVVVLGVSLLQFMERLPDRQAVEHLKYHVGWKYALGHELGDDVFDATVLVRFRQRLLAHGEERAIFEEVLDALEEAGLVNKRHNRQRLDSTHMLGLVSRMSALDRIREALRLALEELEEAVSSKPSFWEMFWERYVEHEPNYKSSAAVLENKRVQAGEDAHRLLEWLREHEISGGPKTGLLKRVFGEHFRVAEGQIETVQVTASCVANPHDPDATYREKQNKNWVGYGIQVAESLPGAEVGQDEGGVGFITSIVTHTANGSDEAGMTQTLEEQAAMGFEKPKELYVDAAYVSSGELAKAQAESRELLGPAVSARKPKEGYSVEEFEVDLDRGEAVCPAGQTNTQLSRVEDRTRGILEYRFEWSWKCSGCSQRGLCISAKQQHRTIRVNSNYMHLQARRREMDTEAFQEKMNRRAGIEGTLSELVRGYGARRARYRGLPKGRLQNYFIGSACNIRRWLRRIAAEIEGLPALRLATT